MQRRVVRPEADSRTRYSPTSGLSPAPSAQKFPVALAAGSPASEAVMSPRWRVVRGLELSAYAACLFIVIRRIPVICSPLWLQECIAARSCKRFLRSGWLGPTRDSADDQWRELRESLPLISAAIVVHAVLSLLVRRSYSAEDMKATRSASISPSFGSSGGSQGSRASRSRLRSSARHLPMGTLGRKRAVLNVAVSFVVISLLHGTHTIFPIALVSASFAVGHGLKGTRYAQPVTWVMAVFFVWLKEKWWRAFTFERVLGQPFEGMDALRGIHPWRLCFNLAVLRVVSFNVDLHWAEKHLRREKAALPAEYQAQAEGGSGARHRQVEADVRDYAQRVLAHRPASDYSLLYFLGYVFYAPLYLAGPTLTFNAYVSYMACPQRSYGRARMAFYLARLLFALLCLEYAVHKLPVFALARSGLLDFRPDIMGLFVYSLLHTMWLKFLVIWRLFRFWALCDGVEPPENMQKCMSDNYSVVGFWKGWHCSFNRWLVRYIYVPLGGSKRGRMWNVFVVFLFVAFWHDVEPRLFAWGLLNGVFLALEIAVSSLYRRSGGALQACRENALVNRMVQAAGSTLNIMALLLVNMIGYAVGIKGIADVADGMFNAREGLMVFCISFVFLYSGVQIMFAIEEARSRRGHAARS